MEPPGVLGRGQLPELYHWRIESAGEWAFQHYYTSPSLQNQNLEGLVILDDAMCSSRSRQVMFSHDNNDYIAMDDQWPCDCNGDGTMEFVDCDSDTTIDECEVDRDTCFIGGMCYDEDDINPTNECQLCDPSADPNTWSNRADGTPCDDGLFCNGTETCTEGTCGNSTGDPCLGPDGDADCQESCNENADSCTGNDPNGSACSDGFFCNGTETCNDGVCGGSTGNPCDGPDGDDDCQESCDETNDNCTKHDPDGVPCDDGLYCNGKETCHHGVCGESTGDPCAGPDGDMNCRESCDEASDACIANDPDGSPCDDGLYCNGTEMCMDGLCGHSTGDPCPGPDGDGNCRESCDETIDACLAPDPDGTTCDDGDFCNGTETCQNGECVAGTAPCLGQLCNESDDTCYECVSEEDADNDGIFDCFDACLDTPQNEPVDQQGCSCSQYDEDGDGVNDCEDICPDTPPGTDVDQNGCSVEELPPAECGECGTGTSAAAMLAVFCCGMLRARRHRDPLGF